VGFRWKFIYQRSNEPATDIEIDLKFVGQQDNQWIIEVTSTLINKSLVRHHYRDFQVSVRYILPEDKIKDGEEKLLYQLSFPRNIDERIDGKKRYFANVDYLNPKQEFKHRYITSVTAEATYVWVQCQFFFKHKREIKCNSQRIFRVPKTEEKSSLSSI
jgi:hypothetical protein